MSNQEYIEKLCGGSAPGWVCSQIADELDARDKRIEELKKEVAEWRLIGEDLLITNKWNHNRVARMMNMRKALVIKTSV